MMKAFKVVMIVALVVVLVVIAVLGIGVWYANRYVQSPEFKQQVTQQASRAIGTPVEINEMKVSLFRGIELRGVTVANPATFPGNFLTARVFRLQYSLWALLRRRIDVQTLTLEAPVILLAKNAKGNWNYEKLGSATPAPEPAPTTPGPAAGPALDVSIRQVEMTDGTVTMLQDTGKELLRIENVEFRSSVDLTGGQLSGRGQTRIQLINAANSVLVRNVAAPVTITPEAVKLAPLSGTLAGGNVSGDAALSLAGDSRYTVNLQVQDADVVTMVKEAGVARQVFSSGKLQLQTTLSGTGGLETIVGQGTAEILRGQLVDIPALTMVALLLQVSALQNLQFDEFRLEYTISNNVMQTPVIRIKSPQVQITGSGRVALADYSLDHQLTLALAAGMLDNAPQELRSQFTRRDDGFFAIEFRVWGPYDAPKTDLQKKLLQGTGEQLLKKGLEKLLR